MRRPPSEFDPPRTALERVEGRTPHLRAGGRVDRPQRRRQVFALLPIAERETVPNQVDDTGLQRRRGETAAKASLIPFRPSVTTMRMSWPAPRLEVGEDCHPEFGALGLLDPHAQDVARPVGQDGQRQIHSLAPHHRFVTDQSRTNMRERDRTDKDQNRTNMR